MKLRVRKLNDNDLIDMDVSYLPDENSYRFVALLNKKVEMGILREQLNATEAAKEGELEYFGLCMFGKTEVLREFTGKFSLFK